jgi:hypothetical protein
MKDDPIGCGEKREATSRTVKIQVNGNNVCVKMNAYDGRRSLGSLYSICCHLYSCVSNTQRSFIYRAGECSPQSCAQGRRHLVVLSLTSDARIVKSTEEDDVVLPKRHSRCGLLKKRV